MINHNCFLILKNSKYLSGCKSAVFGMVAAEAVPESYILIKNF